MKQLKVLFATVLTGIGVALTYHVFETVVHASINQVWYDWFNTDTNRWIVIPLAIVLGLVYFEAQHFLDRKAENSEEHGLGNAPKPTVRNFATVLFVGFFSLLAGATLGPEAILVPASMILGGMVGKAMAKSDDTFAKLCAAAAIMALFTAFFGSVLVGILSLLLVMSQAKVKFQPALLLIAVVASLSSYLTLQVVAAKAYIQLPTYSWALNVETVVLSVLLLVVGYSMVVLIDRAHSGFDALRKADALSSWWARGLVAAAGIAILYIIGGPLVEFTGNLSIQPLFAQASTLGLSGLVIILIVKILAMAWSKALGYRGGMIFPTIFLAAVVVAILQLYVPTYNMIYGLVVVIIGALAANRQNHTLV